MINKLVVLVAIVVCAVACSQQDTDETSKPQKIVVKIRRPQITKKSESVQIAKNSQEVETNGENPKKLDTVKEDAVAKTETQKMPPEQTEEDKPGWHVTKEKETLATIAGKPEVYSDQYRWPSLLRLNLDQLEPLGLSAGIETKELPPGLRLRYLSPQEIVANRTKFEACRWVVNILSDRNSNRISALAIEMVKNGIPVYIAKAEIKGQQWLRLRTGFFPDLDQAKAMRARLEQITGAHGLWIAKISDQEFEKYAGY